MIKGIVATGIGGLIVGFAIVTVAVLQIETNELEAKHISTEQLSWNDSARQCRALESDWRLPSIIELLALNYDTEQRLFIEQTDYWSSDSFFGYAFGLNTTRGITSFDRHTDTDHFLCVRNVKRPA